MPRLRRTSAIFFAATLTLVVAASCSSSKSAGTVTAPTTTTVAQRTKAYANAGPYAVGFTQMKLADGRHVVVWYPSTKAAIARHSREQVDIAGFLSPELQAKIPASDRVKYPADAYENAAPRSQQGGYPVVVFSHGYAGFPEQSVTLTTHLASWGFVVAAPDHVERSLDGLLGTAGKGVAKSTDPKVLSATLSLVEAQSAKSGTLLHGTIDPKEAAVAGHSAGASAAYETAAADPRFKAWISYAVGFGNGEAGSTQTIPAPPDKPGMVMLGTKDGIIPPAASEAVFAQMRSPKYLVKIADAGHLVFSDLCLIGSSKGGIVNIAKSLQLPIPPSLFRLASDGCGPAFPPVTKAFPAIDSASVSFLRWVFHLDATPSALSTGSLNGLGAPVTVSHD